MAATIPVDHPHRLPQPRASLIGRVREVGDVAALLVQDGVALVTLTGPGGVGKTRLALEAAAQVCDHFADGVVFAPLAAIHDSSLVLPAIARAVGVRETTGNQLLEQVRSTLAERTTLLLLDNFEQVVSAAPVVAELLAQCPPLTVLTTSRERLQVSGEHEYPVAPLHVIETPASLSLDDLARSEAIQLFVTRAQSVKPGFALTADSAPAVADICRRLDGLPLAIELAAARIKVLPPATLRSRLEHALPMLTGGGRDLPEHQQTMRTTIAWSYDLLSPTEQRFFRRLGVFTGGFTLEAFESVCGDLATPELDSLTMLASLVDKSLVRVVDMPEGTPRYLMLETVREFAEEQLGESDEETDARERHAQWCLSMAHAVAPVFEQIPSPVDVQRVDAEHANLRAALSWLDASNRTGDLLRLAADLGDFWYMAGYHPEGLAWLERAVERWGDEPTPDYIAALLNAGHLAGRLGDARARAYLQQGRGLAQASGLIGLEALAALALGIVTEDEGYYEEAEALLLSARELGKQTGFRWVTLSTGYHLGIVAYGQGKLRDAVARLEAVWTASHDAGDVLIPPWCATYLALIACEENDVRHAAHRLRQVLRLTPATGNGGDDSTFLGSTAALAAALGEWESVARLLGAAAAAHQHLPFPLPEGVAFDKAKDSARQRKGADAFDAAWDIGTRLSNEAIRKEIERLVAMAEGSHPSESDARAEAILTPREREVLRLLIQGCSNREIAEQLFISPRTATTHVTNILAKFDVDTRTAAVTYAFEHDLV